MCDQETRHFDEMADESKKYEKNTVNSNQIRELCAEIWRQRLKLQEAQAQAYLFQRDTEEVYNYIRMLISFMPKNESRKRMNREIERLERQQKQRFSRLRYMNRKGGTSYNEILLEDYNEMEVMGYDSFHSRCQRRLPVDTW